MQNKLRAALIVPDHLLIDMVFLPVLQHFGFFFRQTRAHFKWGLHLVDGIIVILRQSFQLSSILYVRIGSYSALYL